MTATGTIWNGTWRIRRDPSDLASSAPLGGGFHPFADDIAALPPAIRDTIATLARSVGVSALATRLGLAGEHGECEVSVTTDGDELEVVVTGAADPADPVAGPRTDPVAGPDAGLPGLDPAHAEMLELSHNGVWVVDTEGRTTFANRRMAELLGYQPDELIKRPLLSLLDDADRWRVISLFDRRRTDGAELSDVRFRRRDGSDLWAILATSPLVQDGEVTAIVTVVTDVTERHERERALARAELRFRSSFQDAPFGKALVNTDGVLVEANRALGQLVGRDADELTGMALSDLADTGSDALGDLVAQVADGPLDGFRVEARLVHASGAAVWAEVEASLVRDDDGAVLHLLLQVEDITARKRAEASSRAAVARFQAAFVHAPIGMAIVELDGTLREANPGLCRMLDLDPDTVRLLNLVALADPDDAEQLSERFAQLRDGRATNLRFDVRLTGSDGRTVWTLLSAAIVDDESGLPAYAIVQAEDVTERRVAEHDLVHQTLHDPLTGLGNRILLKDHLQQALAIVGDLPFAVMFLDLDRFKSVNDTHGHDVGDALLVGVADRLRRIVRGGDTVARLGGDEFAVIARGISDQRSADTFAEKVRAALRAPFRVGDLDLTATASVGVVLGSTEYATGDQLLRDADIAMYRAKDGGRDRHEVFDDEVRLQEIARLETERTVRAALQDAGLRLHYQPLVDLHTGRAVGAEALLRIDDGAEGLLPPAQFLAVAEDSRLILDVGAWVLREAAAQLARWTDAGFGHLSVWVNVSALELASPRLVALVQRVLGEFGVEPSRLHLECTENVLLEASPATLGHLRDLAQMGVPFGIDDFGTGYSSLAHLQQLPVSYLKIDPAFTRRVAEPGGAALAEAIVGLGKSLQLEVVAEGVETRRQMEELARIGCGVAQGYLFAAPTPIEGLSLQGDTGVGAAWG